MTINERCFFLDSLNQPGSLIFIESIATIVVNLLCSLIATTGNSIIIVTFWRRNNLRSPSHLLLWCLAFADLITGLIVQPFYASHKISYLLDQHSLSCFFRIIMETVAWFSAGVSCFMFAAITAERYFALYFNLRYHEVITTRRIMAFTVFVVLSLGSLTVSRFAMKDITPFLVLNIAGVLFSLLMLLVSCWKIYSLVRRHHRQIQSQQTAPAAPSASDLKSLMNSALNMTFMASLYIIAYLPFTCVLMAYLARGFTTNIEAAYDITRTIAFMTASWNPFLYCWKMTDMKEAVKKTLRRQTGTVQSFSMRGE